MIIPAFSVCLSVFQPSCLTVCHSLSFCLSLSLCVSACLFISFPVYLSTSISIPISISLSLYLTIFLRSSSSFYLKRFLSVDLFFYFSNTPQNIFHPNVSVYHSIMLSIYLLLHFYIPLSL